MESYGEYQYTESKLSTTIGGAAIITPSSNLNWNNLQNVPTGLNDGDELDILDSTAPVVKLSVGMGRIGPVFRTIH